MNAMVLAAGRGERLRPLTDHTPKPLVIVQGQPVIVHTLLRLAQLGIAHVVINACYLADKLIDYVGDGAAWGVQVTWSREKACLDTGGGVVHALHHMGEAPFLVVNGDILWNMDLRPLLEAFDPQTMDALLGVVSNPVDSDGDFCCRTEACSSSHRQGRASPPYHHGAKKNHHPLATLSLRRVADCSANEKQKSVTYSGIQVLSPQALGRYSEEPFSLNLFYDDALQAGRLRGLFLQGHWADMGTPERLKRVQKMGWTLDRF